MSDTLFKVLTVFLLVTSCLASLPPNILKHPEDHTFGPDEEIPLHCEATGAPTVQYSWTHNDQPMDNNTDHIYKVGSHGSIRIHSAYRNDEGKYQCFAQNHFGRTLSRIATLSYAIMNGSNAPTFQFTVIIGEHLAIPCEGVKSFPPPILTWAIGETEMDDSPTQIVTDSRIQIDHEGALHFANVENKDAQNGKVYMCIVYNPYLEQTARGSFSKINVRQALRVHKSPTLIYTIGSEIVGLEGEDIRLKCLFKGPTPSLDWVRPGGQLPHGRSFKEKSNTELLIKDLSFDEEGYYRCIASNMINKHTASIIKLVIQSKPSFQRLDPNDSESQALKPSNLNVTEGDDATFMCVPNGINTTSIQWFINGNELKSSCPYRMSLTENETKLTIHDVCKICDDRPTDLMVILCFISSAHGSAFSQGYLNIVAVIEDDITEIEYASPFSVHGLIAAYIVVAYLLGVISVVLFIQVHRRCKIRKHKDNLRIRSVYSRSADHVAIADSEPRSGAETMSFEPAPRPLANEQQEYTSLVGAGSKIEDGANAYDYVDPNTITPHRLPMGASRDGYLTPIN